jgi:biopolymer transport protein ExbD
VNYVPYRRRRVRPDFSLAIVNIVFLLLIFHLAAGSLVKPDEAETEAPVTADLPLDLLPRPLLLIGEGGRLFLDGVEVETDALPEIARSALADGGVLSILADRSMQGRAFLEILGRLDAAGIPLQIVTVNSDGEAAGRGP